MTWPQALDQLWDAPAHVLERRRLAGGYTSRGVERLDLDVAGRVRTVVLKHADPAEVAAMRAIAVVGGVDRSRALAIGPDWLLLPFVDGPALGGSDPVPDEVWTVMARVHAHWWRRRPRGLPVVDAEWWRQLCERTLVALRGGAERTGEAAYRAAVDAVSSWRDDERIATALAVLPRTLTHGDPHRGNVLVDAAGPVLIDWGNARVAPAGVDIAVLTQQYPCPTDAYEHAFVALTGERADRLRAVEQPWARLHVHVQYLGFAADHLGASRVAEMIDAASSALNELDAVLWRR